MNSRFILAALASLAMVSCVEPLVPESSDKGGSKVTVSVPDDSEVDAALFSAVDLNSPGLEKAKSEYEAGHLYLAAKAVLEYFRNRTSVSDPAVNLILPKATSEETLIAYWALSASSYRFYTEGFMDPKDENVPCSYLNGKTIDWSLCASGDVNQTYMLNRLAWMPCQGKQYRLSHDETFAKEWVNVWTGWKAYSDTTTNAGYAWRVDDAAERVVNLTTAWEYFLQSTNVTPQFASRFLAAYAEDVKKLANSKTLTENAAAALSRAGLVFPEMAGSDNWSGSGSDYLNSLYEAKWFEAVNMDYPGLEKVKACWNANDRKGAAEAMLEYFRTRNCTVNPNVNLASVSVSANDQLWADYALKENGYRFYVPNYYESGTMPYSYITDSGNINWQYWPTKDQEQRYQINRLQWMLPQARVYYTSKNEKYAKSFMEVYLDWYSQNPKPDKALDYSLYPENQPEQYRNGAWAWRSLEAAVRLLDQCDIIEYYKASPSITPEFLMQYLYRVAEQANHIRTNYSSTSNHLITQAQAVAAAGILFPEMKEAQIWASSGSKVLNQEVTAQYYNDGWLMDGDFHYHISSIEDFRSTLYLFKANGQESVFPEAYLNSMKKMMDVVVNMTFPDYSSVNMTDTRSDVWNKSVLTKNFNRYSQLFPTDQSYLWMATAGAQGSAPANLACNFPDCGYYVLRSGWSASDIMMVLENSTQTPSEKWHRQWDNGTFELYYGGRMLFKDSGCYTYNTGTTRSKYAATTAHNTLSLDGKNVTSCRGKMLQSTSANGTDVLVLSNPSYSNLTHRRTVFFVERKFFVIVDEAYGNAAGTVNLNFNLPAGSDTEVVADLGQNGAHTAFADGKNMLVRTFSPSALTSVAKEGFISTNIDKTVSRQAYQVNLAKTADMTARYVTVILPAANAASSTVSASLPEAFSAGSVAADVTVDGKTWNLKTTINQ